MGGWGLGSDHNVWFKNYHFLFLLQFAPEAFKMSKKIIKNLFAPYEYYEFLIMPLYIVYTGAYNLCLRAVLYSISFISVNLKHVILAYDYK